MIFRKLHSRLCLIVSLLLLTDCSNSTKTALGLRKAPPDEFTVVSYPPLSTPPILLNGSDTMEQKEVSYNDNNHQDTKKPISKHDSEFLAKIGDAAKHSLTGQELDNDDNSTLASKLKKFQKEDKDPVVDAEAEKKRIADNLKNNKPINEGNVIEKDINKSVLEKILS